jgi:hypothetical protein
MNISLHTTWNEEILSQSLFPIEDWKPFPIASDRDAWDAIPEAMRTAMVGLAEEGLATAWPHVPATVYLQFSQNGNRIHYEDLHFGRRKILCDLMIGECIEGKGRFMPAVLDALWSICEESSWCLPAHSGMQRAGVGLPDIKDPTVDLFAAETGALLAWTGYLLGAQLEAISPLVLPRIYHEVQQRILIPALARDDLGWMGFVERPVNNWNPWINSNWLACALLLEKDAPRRLAAVSKILRSLDIFLADYPADGGCDEGPDYWGRAGASLFDCLELLFSASAGSLTAYSDPLIRNIGQYIYRVHIAGIYYVNFADASAVVQPDAMLVRQFGTRIEDETMVSFGVWLAKRAGMLDPGYDPLKADRSSSPTRELPALFGLKGLSGEEAKAPLLRDIWLPGIEVMAARDQESSTDGLYLAVKGGHNAESHNHNDVGHFVVYRDGKPLIIDAGVETYTRKTFSPQRYEIWTMQSAYHSLPTIDGIQQAPGRGFRSRNVRIRTVDEQAEFSLDIAGAYPVDAGLHSWIRHVSLERGKAVRLVDSYELIREAHNITLSLMTVCAVDLSCRGLVGLGVRILPDGRTAGTGSIRYDGDRLSVTVEEVPIYDLRMRPVWGASVYRLLFTDRSPGNKGQWEFKIE